jgi:solute carrier family 8 (sodium/calcium exchanger)
MTILPQGVLAIVYSVFLFYVFVGLFVISDVMHAGIEKITSSRKTTYETHDGVRTKFMTPVWNPTLANLTLMTIGNSAPEIFLNLIETIKTLDNGRPSELGIVTIIGSAAFNLFVITGISIASVNVDDDMREQFELDYDQTPRGVKKIRDSGVYGTTALCSLIAYFWVWFVFSGKEVMGGGVEISLIEAFITFFAYFAFLGLAYCADRIHEKRHKDREVKAIEHARVHESSQLEIIEQGNFVKNGP